MLKRSVLRYVPFVTKCHALYHGGFEPVVRMPMPVNEVSPYVKTTNAKKVVRKKAVEADGPQSVDSKNEKKMHTLVLDIDETLIHTFSTEGTPAMKLGAENQPKGFEDVADLVRLFEEKKKLGGNRSISLEWSTYFQFWTRPYLQEFLEEVTDLFEVVFWTAGTSSYMTAVINALERQVLHNILAGGKPSYLESPSSSSSSAAASHCIPNGYDAIKKTSYMYDFTKNIKDIATVEDMTKKKIIELAKKASPLMNYYGYSKRQTLGSNALKHLPLLTGHENSDNIILLDDATRSFVFTPRSAVLAKQFKGKDDDDTFLRDIMPMLRAVAKSDNAAKELDHWREDGYTTFDDLDRNSDKFLMASPSSVKYQKDIQIGSFISKRRENGPIAPAKLHGKEFDEKKSAELMKEISNIHQKFATDTPGLHFYF